MSFENIYLQLMHRFLTKFDAGHQISHSLIVAGHAYSSLKDFPELTSAQKDSILVAALLHDFNDHKFIPKSEQVDLYNLLSDHFNEETIKNIVEMIDLISCSKNGDTEITPSWMAVPRYADRLEAMGAIGLSRAIFYSKHTGRPFINADTPRVYNEEELDKVASKEKYIEYTQGKRNSPSTIDHLYDKVLHLDVPDWLGSETLKGIANERKIWLKQYIINFFNEKY